MAYGLRGAGGRFVSQKVWLETPRTPMEIMQATSKGLDFDLALDYYEKLRSRLIRQRRDLEKAAGEGSVDPFPADLVSRSKIGNIRELSHMISRAQGIDKSGEYSKERLFQMQLEMLSELRDGPLDADAQELTKTIFGILHEYYPKKSDRNARIGSERVIELAQELSIRHLPSHQFLENLDSLEFFLENVTRMQQARVRIKPQPGQRTVDAWRTALEQGMI